MKRKKSKNKRTSKKLKTKKEEPSPFYFSCLPRDMEIIISSFVISEIEKDWKRNWNNISLVSKHWNSIAWISFQRAIPKSEKETIFIESCKKGCFHFINKFLIQDATFDPSFQNNEAIVWACKIGNIEIVRMLLEDVRVDPSTNSDFCFSLQWRRYLDKNTMLMSPPFVNCIMDITHTPFPRFPREDYDNSAIIMASVMGHIDIVNLLFQDKRVNPCAQNNSALLYSCFVGSFEVVKKLLQDSRVDPSRVDPSGYLYFIDIDPIAYASMGGQIDVVKLLLQDKRIDPSNHNNFAITMARRNKYTAIVDLLMQDNRVLSLPSSKNT